MDPDVSTDDLPSIALEAKIGGHVGRLYLSQVYGSYNKRFSEVEDIDDSIAEFSCPHCHRPFPVHQICDCGAPMIGLNLQTGGVIKICTRNGCKNHSLEFTDANDAYRLFQSQDRSGLV